MFFPMSEVVQTIDVDTIEYIFEFSNFFQGNQILKSGDANMKYMKNCNVVMTVGANAEKPAAHCFI